MTKNDYFAPVSQDDAFVGYGSDQSVVLSGQGVLTQEVIEEMAQKLLEESRLPDPPYMVNLVTYAWCELYNNQKYIDIVFNGYRKHQGKVSRRRYKNIMMMRKRLFAKTMVSSITEANKESIIRQVSTVLGKTEAKAVIDKYF